VARKGCGGRCKFGAQRVGMDDGVLSAGGDLQ
jgi:hypothetical protein